MASRRRHYRASMLLRPSELFRSRAVRIWESTAELVKGAGVGGVLTLVGGCSVDGALTRGDVDLHLRVSPADFDRAVATLRSIMVVARPEIWCPSLATFELPAELPTGLAVTPVGSEHDIRFTRTWQLLSADPDLLADYNEVKRSSRNSDYEERKSAFFERMLATWPSHPAGGIRQGL